MEDTAPGDKPQDGTVPVLQQKQALPSPRAAPTSPPALEQHLTFLFGDSNLLRDNFLRCKLWGERGERERLYSMPSFPAGPLMRCSELLSFPLVATLSRGSLEAVKVAASRAPGVVLSPDTYRVGRSTPWVPPPPGYFDTRTVYVEGLPPGVGIAQISQLFSK